MPQAGAHVPDSAPVEITIEAEPPPAHGSGAVVNWDKYDVPSFDEVMPPASAQSDRTLPGLGYAGVLEPVVPAAAPGVPEPPAGMASPPAVQPSASAQPAASDAAVQEAVSRLSRDVIERIVWEVVPDLAETIIREELERLIEKRRSG